MIRKLHLLSRILRALHLNGRPPVLALSVHQMHPSDLQ